MNTVYVNLISAIAIGLVIYLMARIRDAHLKALVYSLPIPITIALLATGGRVDSSNIIGLALVILFLWAVTALVSMGWSIWVADVASAAAYLAAGYFLVHLWRIDFAVASSVFVLLWIAFNIGYKDRVPTPAGKARLSPVAKLVVVTPLAYILLSLKQVLAGVVVTFPFSGVFAVIEGQHMLHLLSATVTRNSIAILALFAVVHYTSSRIGVVSAVALGWVVYAGCLYLVTKWTARSH